jgi:predicted GNAT family acetyltransferase
MASEPTVTNNPSASRFEIIVDGQVAGFSEYRRGEGVIESTHTVIEDAYEGQGLGGTLVREALDEARREGLQVVATCPFVKDYIERHPEHADLLAPGQ